MHETLAIEGGFADPVIASQRGFKAIMDALARPGTVQRPARSCRAARAAVAWSGRTRAHPLRPRLAGLARPRLAEGGAVADWLRFHTAAPLVHQPHDATSRW